MLRLYLAPRRHVALGFDIGRAAARYMAFASSHAAQTKRRVLYLPLARYASSIKGTTHFTDVILYSSHVRLPYSLQPQC
jgi:hypothetical protein